MSGEAPEIQDDPGSLDENFARVILILPWLAILAVIGAAIGAVFTGMIVIDVTITGSVSAQYLVSTFARPLAYGVAAALGLVYVLAAAKEWGIAPIRWITNAARDYQPDRRD